MSEKDYTNEIELIDMHYEHDSISDEGQLLIKVKQIDDIILCNDVECGSRIEFLKKKESYKAFLMTFAIMAKVNEEPGGKKIIEKNTNKSVLKMRGVVLEKYGEWYICDVGFYIYAMCATAGSSFKPGDWVNLAGGVRVEIVLG
ncbi:MAG: hypothetical protein QMC67_07770 [Candidatus Wallbacteria bacterium]